MARYTSTLPYAQPHEYTNSHRSGAVAASIAIHLEVRGQLPVSTYSSSLPYASSFTYTHSWRDGKLFTTIHTHLSVAGVMVPAPTGAIELGITSTASSQATTDRTAKLVYGVGVSDGLVGAKQRQFTASLSFLTSPNGQGQAHRTAHLKALAEIQATLLAITARSGGLTLSAATDGILTGSSSRLASVRLGALVDPSTYVSAGLTGYVKSELAASVLGGSGWKGAHSKPWLAVIARPSTEGFLLHPFILIVGVAHTKALQTDVAMIRELTNSLVARR